MSRDAAGVDGGRADPRWVLRIAAALAAVLLLVLIATAVLAPEDPPVPSEAFGRQFLTSCARTGVEEDRCRCAWDAWQATVPPAEQAALEDALADGADLPDAVRSAIERCTDG